MAATERGHGLLGTKFGIYGKDNVVCSESSLLAIARASKPSIGMDEDAIAKKIGRQPGPIAVTPGDIYTQDGKGYFIVRPLHVDDKE